MLPSLENVGGATSAPLPSIKLTANFVSAEINQTTVENIKPV